MEEGLLEMSGAVCASFMTQQLRSSSATWILFTLGLTQAGAKCLKLDTDKDDLILDWTIT